ncbi:MAG: hypothetical protein HY302_16955 [Opitutae bacterium]|nr:hypothetical protein [Opitutae bacterium]
MNWLKTHPVLGAALLLLVAGLGAELWLLDRFRQAAQHAHALLEQKKLERDWLARQSPAPSAENEQAIETELAAVAKTVAGLRAALQGRETNWLAKPAPAKSIDAYFDVAAFVEKTRALAARTRVAVQPGEKFGFATHANEGPEPDLLLAVFRQRLIVERLLDELLAARPQALLAVQREHPLTVARRAARSAAPGAGPETDPPVPAARKGEVPADFFTPDPRLSLQRAGVIGAEAFRLEFTGQTPALRGFLNSLAAYKVPLIVRSVAVESLSAEPPLAELSDSPAPVPGAAPVPLVAQNLSKFTVVVEYVELLSAPAARAP